MRQRTNCSDLSFVGPSLLAGRRFGRRTRSVLAWVAFVGLVLLGMEALDASAALITWSQPATVQGDADVLTNGTLAYAYDWANASQSLNGAAFVGSSSTSTGGTNVQLNSFPNRNGSSFTSTNLPFAALSSTYKSILVGADYADGGIPVTVTLANLFPGDDYAVQVWANDPRGGSTGTRTEIVSNSIAGGQSVTLKYNTTATAGGLGQYTVGRFTADGPTQSFLLFGSASTQLNAMQLRDLSAPHSKWVWLGTNGTLRYAADNLGNRLPDFSYAGYQGGGVPLPVVAVTTNVSPVSGDNTANIQNAINYVSGLAMGGNGVRGAVQLNPGQYEMYGSLTLNTSGVVLRGSGSSPTGSVLHFVNASRQCLTLQGSGGAVQQGGSYTVADSYVALGATNFHVNTDGIIWGASKTIAGDTDVFTNGTPLYAYDWLGTDTNVNGVAFTGATNANGGGDVSVSGIGGIGTSFTNSNPPFSALSAAYRSILGGGLYGGASTATITLKNLTVGNRYAVQVWVNDSRGGSTTAGRTETVTGQNIVRLAYCVSQTPGGVGQYTIGTFTAAGTTQLFQLASASSTQINALLVSDVTATGYQPVNPSTNLAPFPFSVGDHIIVRRPVTQPWIDAIGMSNYWVPNGGLGFERTITAISSNQVSVDIPICNPIESAWTTGSVYEYTDGGRILNSAVEHLRLRSDFNDFSTNWGNGRALWLDNAKNCWVQDVVVDNFYNGINDGRGAKSCTIQDCYYVSNAVPPSNAGAGGFGGYGGLMLYQRCGSSYSTDYHLMGTQSGAPGPIVFLNFNASGTGYDSGPHQNWAAGVLFDQDTLASLDGSNTGIKLENRGAAGRTGTNNFGGQGYGAGFSLIYNCNSLGIINEIPQVTNHYNWVIGGSGTAIHRSDDGIWDMFGTMLNPRSLYLEQLKERLGPAAVENIGYTVFTTAAAPLSQYVSAGDSVVFTVSVTGTNGFSEPVTLGTSGLPAGATASFGANPISGNGSAALTLSTVTTLAPGTYPFIVTTSAGNLTKGLKLTLVVGPPRNLTFGSVVSTGPNLVWSGSGGITNGTYRVLTTTNPALPMASWSLLSTGLFDDSGGFYFTNPPGPGPGRFFRLSVP